MSELLVHRVNRVNVHVKERLNSNSEPYQVISITVYGAKDNLEVTLFGSDEERIQITYGEE